MAWRVKEFLGWDAGIADTEHLGQSEDDGNADLVVIHDASRGFRDSRALWPASLLNPKKDAWVLLKRDQPDFDDGLWSHLLEKFSQRTVAIVTVNDLRALVQILKTVPAAERRGAATQVVDPPHLCYFCWIGAAGMRAPATTDVTALLMEWQDGDPTALDRLLPLVYSELRNVAAGYLRNERPGHTLQPTALIHEAYLRLVNQEIPRLRGRRHFYGVAAHLMRQVLVDSARSRNAGKRGSGELLSLKEIVAAAPRRPYDILALDEALSELAKVDERKMKVIEMRYFGGLANEEIADTIGVSVPTVVRYRRFAEAWLRQHLRDSHGPGAMARG